MSPYLDKIVRVPTLYNMGHNGHGINLYGVLMIPVGNLHAGGHSDRGTLSPSTPAEYTRRH